ncbi:toll-interacting protein-like [Anthonomus grandis grandis]|uniref:toll-interacting protein-like n=1 Tax=Anthonomus grandis grandis TaxID=2921223 RepID=UPI0021655C12|nr:toll-interacting protein-like [Anthonomus grandis grandis]
MEILNQFNTVCKNMASAVSNSIKDRRNRVLLGPLPDDFLRINISPQEQQEAADRQTALALQQQYTVGMGHVPNPAGRLSITIVQAKLAKNYGMTRMDPYCRIRVGHNIYETPTDSNGGKNPRWNKVIYCLIPQGINTMNIEIFDERSFTMDELIAWTQISIPQKVLAGETHEDWYALSGKQGEGVEGMINLVLSYNASGYQPASYPVMIVPRVDSTGVKPLQVYAAPPHAGEPQPSPQTNQAGLVLIEEMFPNIDKEVVKTVFEANRGNKDKTIHSLLQMSGEDCE